MNRLFTYYLALRSFFRKLCRDIPLLYRQELRSARHTLAVVETLKAGWTPQAMAMGICADEGESYGSKRCQELLEVVQEVQQEFNLQGGNGNELKVR